MPDFRSHTCLLRPRGTCGNHRSDRPLRHENLDQEHVWYWVRTDWQDRISMLSWCREFQAIWPQAYVDGMKIKVAREQICVRTNPPSQQKWCSTSDMNMIPWTVQHDKVLAYKCKNSSHKEKSYDVWCFSHFERCPALCVKQAGWIRGVESHLPMAPDIMCALRCSPFGLNPLQTPSVVLLASRAQLNDWLDWLLFLSSDNRKYWALGTIPWN